MKTGARDSPRRMETYHTLVLVQHLIVLAQGDQEDECGDVFETVDPLFTLGTLATYVEHVYPIGVEDEDEEDADDPSDVAMVPMADMLNAQYESENVRNPHFLTIIGIQHHRRLGRDAI